MSERTVATTEEVPPGERVIVEVEGREIAVFNLEGEYYAYLNFCAHQAGPLCEGVVGGVMDASFDRESLEYSYEWQKDGEVIACPWHNWKYDLRTGECLSREGISVPSFPVRVDGDEIVLAI